ncbi:MAG TPA: ribosome maturation factor RimP [Bryobacteraceae bacterium]
MAGNRESIIERVTAIAERVAASEGIEIVNVEFVGGGRNRVLRLFIDRFPPEGQPVPIDAPTGATLEDCELVSHEVGTILDVEDVIPGEGYKLEVSSPGVERSLYKLIDFQRFTGHQAKVTLKPPSAGGSSNGGQAHLMGVLRGTSGDIIHLESGGKTIDFPFEQVLKASLKFRW